MAPSTTRVPWPRSLCSGCCTSQPLSPSQPPSPSPSPSRGTHGAARRAARGAGGARVDALAAVRKRLNGGGAERAQRREASEAARVGAVEHGLEPPSDETRDAVGDG
jgi:hypothetical protein